jgi:hypothetical protein
MASTRAAHGKTANAIRSVNLDADTVHELRA